MLYRGNKEIGLIQTRFLIDFEVERVLREVLAMLRVSRRIKEVLCVSISKYHEHDLELVYNKASVNTTILILIPIV